MQLTLCCTVFDTVRLYLAGLNPIFQVVCSALRVCIICLNLMKVSIAYHKTQYLNPFFSHSIPLLSVHSFPHCHSITTCALMIPAVHFFLVWQLNWKHFSPTSCSRFHCWLCLNCANTEFLLLGCKLQLNKIHNPALVLTNGHSVLPIASALNCAFIFIPVLNSLRHIRPVPDFDMTHTIGTSFVPSRLDYCNSVYCCLPKSQVNGLQLSFDDWSLILLTSMWVTGHSERVSSCSALKQTSLCSSTGSSSWMRWCRVLKSILFRNVNINVLWLVLLNRSSLKDRKTCFALLHRDI